MYILTQTRVKEVRKGMEFDSHGFSIKGRLTPDEVTFAVLRTLALAGGVVALFLVPLRPEHREHLFPLIAAFIGYKGLLYLSLYLKPEKARRLFLLTLSFDLAFVFVLIWFTGGFESHFYLLFYLLIALNAYHFGARVGLTAASASGILYLFAYFLAPQSALHWTHLAARIALFGLLGVSLGFMADRERKAKAEAERLNRELEEALNRLREAQQRLIHSERMATIGKMSAKVAHEVRNPLSSISLNAEMLEDVIRACPGPFMAEAAEILASIKTEVEALGGVTEEYLRFARLPRPKPEDDSVNEMLEELLDFIKGEASQRQISITRTFSPNLPPLRFDRALLRQAVLNLIKNAFEAMPSGGELVVGTCYRDGQVRVTVTDTGAGIEEGFLGRVFDPFYTTKDHGTGLGLTIARQIIHDHGGTLTCQSVPGQGATFIISIPKGEAQLYA
ncbi:MAG: hypothetical protein HY998_02215 [candidate division NC10 bacterium]|nr:hypothetical protein [candidate division NC10 bacterium]